MSSYDAFGSVMAMPIGAVVAGPIAAWAGVSATQYGAAALILIVSVFALIPRDIRTLRADQLSGPARAEIRRGEPVDGRLGGVEVLPGSPVERRWRSAGGGVGSAQRHLIPYPAAHGCPH